MTEMWIWVLGACAIAYLTKLSGFLVPDSLLERPWVTTVSAGMTVAAAVALWLRAPYIVVVLVGALAAAAVRFVAH